MLVITVFIFMNCMQRLRLSKVLLLLLVESLCPGRVRLELSHHLTRGSNIICMSNNFLDWEQRPWIHLLSGLCGDLRWIDFVDHHYVRHKEANTFGWKKEITLNLVLIRIINWERENYLVNQGCRWPTLIIKVEIQT